MDKTIGTREWAILVALLREARVAAGVRQTDLAAALRKPQSFVSDVENGQRRVDVYELRVICGYLGLSLGEFIAQWESLLRTQN